MTTNYFTTMGRIWKTTLPDNTSVTNEYFATGLLKKTSGSRTYPVEYTYDSQGRVKTMKTWQAAFNDGTAAVTTWNYSSSRGWLESKRYADNRGPDYTYSPSGRLHERLWARGSPRLKTTYGYNAAGELASVAYSDATAGIAYGYDRRGRQTTITQGDVTTSRSFDDAGNLLSEGYADGPLASLSVTNGYDQFLRRTNLTLLNGQSAVLASTAYTYDEASRLKSVSDGTNSATYSYLANSALVGQIDFAAGGATVMSTVKQYDYLDRLTSISNLDVQARNLGSFAYAYNPANQRTAVTNADSARWVYSYDKLGLSRHWGRISTFDIAV